MRGLLTSQTRISGVGVSAEFAQVQPGENILKFPVCPLLLFMVVWYVSAVPDVELAV
jgi:hypothetical protein